MIPVSCQNLVDDATIRKCIGFAKRWGFTGVHVVNLFAFRATDPRELLKAADPIGPDNDEFIKTSLLSAPRTIVAWGARGSLLGRVDQVAQLLAMCPKVEALAINADGSPQHPLYVPYDVTPMPWPQKKGGG